MIRRARAIEKIIRRDGSADAENGDEQRPDASGLDDDDEADVRPRRYRT
jgi:hypothetical protein